VTELDLDQARRERVSFEGCTLEEPHLMGATYKDVDFSGATLRSPRGVAGLKGAVVGRAQLVDLAEHLAAELGLVVAD
jgi:uncharacterized protein YjbI with pentapeptide repeats